MAARPSRPSVDFRRDESKLPSSWRYYMHIRRDSSISTSTPAQGWFGSSAVDDTAQRIQNHRRTAADVAHNLKHVASVAFRIVNNVLRDCVAHDAENLIAIARLAIGPNAGP